MRKSVSRKQARTQTAQALGSVSTRKDALGEKKYQKRWPRAEKIFSAGLPKKIKNDRGENAPCPGEAV